MSKRADKQRRKKASSGTTIPVRQTSDRAIYTGLVIIGFGAVLLVWLFTDGRWREATWGYCALVAGLVHLHAIRAYRGTALSRWQEAAAKLPLRCAGYGTKQGKPVSAAHNSADAMKMIVVGSVVSVVILLGLAVLLFPAARVWEG